MSTENQIGMKMETITGVGNHLQKLINDYFLKVRMQPAMITSFAVTAGKWSTVSPASVSVKILHRQPLPNTMYRPCRAVVICDGNTMDYDKRVGEVVSNTNDILMRTAEIQAGDDSHYWIGIFAPPV